MSQKKPQQRFNAYVQYSGIGFQMMGAILLCAWIGQWLDQKAGTPKPFITIAGMLFGVGTAVFLMIRSVKRLQAQQEADKKAEKKQ